MFSGANRHCPNPLCSRFAIARLATFCPQCGSRLEAEIARPIDEHQQRRRREDRLFAKALVRKGYLTQQAVASAVRQQNGLLARGTFIRLCDIWLREQTITIEQAEQAFALIERSYVFCPRCLQRHRVSGNWLSEHMRCGRCGHYFAVSARSHPA